jgi:FKBP-type peptidyl-prolyl cis-trans isomerase 2
LSQLQVGGRIRVEVPAAEGYGEAGSPAQGIGPNEDLVFVVDLVSVDATRQYCTENVGIPPAPEGVEDGDTKPTGPIDMPLEPPEELEITTLREGTGPVVAEGDRVALHYVGVSCASGQQFDTSWDRGELFEATAGGDDVIDGFAEGLIGIKIGELRRIDIPAAQAYGDDALIFLLDAREILPPEPEAPPLPDDGGAPAPAGEGEPSEADPSTTTPTE